MHIAIVGLGYVGLTTGVALAHLGHHVTGIDKDDTKLNALLGGTSPIHEEGLQELLNRNSRRLRFTSDTAQAVGDCQVIVIAVGTPQKDNGDADTSYVEAAARDVAQGIRQGQRCTVVVKSTVPIGSNRRVKLIMERALEERGVGAELFFASNPEFLREGRALSDTFYPDRIVVGADTDDAVSMLRLMYRPILEQTFTPPREVPCERSQSLPPLITTESTSAEMIKYAANCFLALKVSYINEIAGLCEKVGADVTEVARGIGVDHRIGEAFLQAGLGWGGSCFPKDTAALISVGREYGYSMPSVEAARSVNLRQRQGIVEKLQDELKVLRGRKIAILGLAFKPGTDDVRESPVIDVVNTLQERGAHLRLHDPVALDNARKLFAGPDIDFMENLYAAAKGADAVVLATAWPEYLELDLGALAASMDRALLVDGRNVFDRDAVETAGFTYLGVGR